MLNRKSRRLCGDWPKHWLSICSTEWTPENENHNKLISNLFKKKNTDCCCASPLGDCDSVCFFSFPPLVGNHYHKFIKQMNKDILLALCRVARNERKKPNKQTNTWCSLHFLRLIIIKIFTDSFVCAFFQSLYSRYESFFFDPIRTLFFIQNEIKRRKKLKYLISWT